METAQLIVKIATLTMLIADIYMIVKMIRR